MRPRLRKVYKAGDETRHKFLVHAVVMREPAVSFFGPISRHEALFFFCVVVNTCSLNMLMQTPYFCAAPEGTSPSTLTSKALSSRLVILIGGHTGSGTTLARAILDAHPDIRCRIESMGMHKILQLYRDVHELDVAAVRLEGAGIPRRLINRASRAFLAEIFAERGNASSSSAKYLCYKGPLLPDTSALSALLPKSKFIFMLRDVRAVAHSVVNGLNISHLLIARVWNKLVKMTVEDCSRLANRCMIVFYEKLVGDPSTQMKEVLRFLDIPWHDNVLRHHEMIGSEVFLSE